MNLPNKLTVLRMAMIPLFVAFMMLPSVPYHFVFALVLFILASLTDLLDGYIARKYNLITDFGKFMDPLADKLLVTAAIVCFVELRIVSAWVVILILAREFLVTSLRLVAANKGIVIAADKWGKYKTVSQMLWIVLDIVFLAANWTTQSWFGAAFLVHSLLLTLVLFLTLFSGWNYIWNNRQVFNQS